MADIKILLVEDDAIEAMDIKRRLESFGYEVPHISAYGNEAINKALEILPDLVLMDITLKGEIDGIQAASRIKDIGIPVIYLTANSDESTVQRAKVTEPYGYIIKPYDPLELKYGIEIALYKKSEEKLRKKAENELKMANLYNRSLIEASLDPLVTIGPEGKITDVNNATERVTGYLKDELIGSDFSDYFTEPEKARKGYQHVFKEGIVRDYPLEIRHKKGDITPVLYNATVYHDESGKVVGVFAAARDITERKRTENIMQARYRLLEFANSHSLDELLTETLDEIESLTGSKISFYHFLEPDQKTLSLQNWSSNTLKNMCNAEGKGRHYDISQAGVWVECVYERRPVIHNDYASLVHRKGLPDGHAPVVRELVVPIFRGNLIKAIIGVGNKSTPYDENDIETVSQLGDLSWDITERKIGEEELKKASLYNRSLIEASLDPLVTIGPEGKITDVNNATERVTGYLKDELIGSDFSNYFTQPKKASEGYQQVFKKGFVRDYPLEIQNKDGKITPVLYNASVYRDDSGDVVGVFAAARDITEAKKAEEKIQMLANVVESSDDAIISKSLKGNINSWNQGAEYIYGYSAEEVLGKDISLLAPPNLKNEIKELIKKIKQGERILHYETLRIRKDRKKINVSLTLSPIFDTSGDLIGISTIARDITERKQAEKSLRASEEKYRNIFEESLDGLFITSPEGKILDMNKKGIEMFGYDTKKEIQSLDLALDVYDDPQDRSRVLAMVNEQGSAEYEVVVKKKNGEKIITHCSLIAAKDKNGVINSYRGIIRDITEQKKAENEIIRAKEEWESTFHAVPDLIAIIDTDYHIVRANKAMANKLGLEPEEAVGLTCYNVVHELNAPPFFCPHSKLLEDGIEHTVEIHEDRLGGDFIVSVSPLYDADAKLMGSVHVARDITERKMAEDEVKKSLKEKEVLLSEIHHRVKNNMQIISSLLNLQSKYITDNEVVDILQASQDRVKAMAAIYEILYQSQDLNRIDFEEYTHKLVNGLFYTHKIKEGQIEPIMEIEKIKLNIETSVPCGLIISELVSNSLKHAFPQEKMGEIKVSLKSQEDKFELCVSDNGIGFPKDLDFRKTESLGLQLVNNLVRQLDGEITLDRAQGTEFKIIFNELKYQKRI